MEELKPTLEQFLKDFFVRFSIHYADEEISQNREKVLQILSDEFDISITENPFFNPDDPLNLDAIFFSLPHESKDTFQSIDSYLLLKRFWAACCVKDAVQDLVECQDQDLSDQPNLRMLFENVHLLGLARGILEGNFSENLPLDLIKTHVQSDYARELVAKRWAMEKGKQAAVLAKDQKTYDEAKKKAREFWADGSRLLDFQMAKHIISQYKWCQHLDQKRLKKELEPIAAEFDRVSGYKNGKKPT